MSLPSSVSFRSSQTDPSSILASPARDTRPADSPDAFKRHLDDSYGSDRSVSNDRNDERRERDAKKTERKDGEAAAPPARSDKKLADSADDAAIAAQLVMLAPETAPDDGAKDADAAIVAEGTPLPLLPEEQQGEEARALPEITDEAAPLPETLADAEAIAPVATDEPSLAQPAKKDDEKQAKPIIADNAITATAPVLAQAVTGQALPVGAKAQASKSEAKPAKAEIPAAIIPAAPQAAAPAPSIDAAVSVNPFADETGLPMDEAMVDGDTDSETMKEGLGHQAASKMAEKGADATAPNAANQSNTAQSNMAQPQAAIAQTPASFAANMAPSAPGDGASVSPTGAVNGSAAASGDAQALPQNQNANATTIRIGTLPGYSQPTQVPAMAIALQMARNLQKGINRFEISLDPAELGRIEVKMEVRRDGHVAAHLTIERPQTLDLLQRDASALQQALNDAGLQADSGSLSFSLRDQDGSSPQQALGNGGLFSDAPDAADATQTQIYNVNLSANGGVDIRV